MHFFKDSPTLVIIAACIAAAVLAVCAVVVLNYVQDSADVAYTTSAGRLR